MELQYPDDFLCPISLHPMSDPVIVVSGHTFDRPSIQQWLDAGHNTCPLSNLPLPPHSPLIPNHALRSLIRSRNAIPSTPPPADRRSLLASLSFPAPAESLASLLRLAKHEPALRRALLDSPAPSVLLRHAAAADPPGPQDLALRALVYLSLDGDGARVGLVADGAIESLARALAAGGPNAYLAATALTSLAVVEVNKCSIGDNALVIPALSALLGGGRGRDRREAATALYEICKFPENRRRAVRSGAVPALVGFAGEGSERAMQVLGLIAKCGEGRECMGGLEGFVRVLAGVLVRGGRAAEHAILVLGLVCSEAERARREAREEGVVEVCLGIGERDCGRVGRNAKALARLIEEGGLGGLV